MIRWHITLTTLFLLAGVALGSYVQIKKTTQRASSDSPRDNRWREDLELFEQKLPSLQLDAAKLYPPAKFHEDVAELEHDVPRLSDSEILLRLMRLVAAAGVSHITVTSQGGLVFHPYPVYFSWYADGAGLNYATEEYKTALGARVVRIGSMTPEELEAAVAPYLSHENPSWLHQLSPEFILNREVAEHFGLTGPDGSVEFTFARPGIEPFKLRIVPVAANAQLHLISSTEALSLPAPLYRRHPDSWYWYEYLSQNHALYIQYNRCQNDPQKPFKDFAQELFKFIDGLGDPEKIERVIVDLRFNSGGDSSVIDPLLQGLQSRPRLSAKGQIFALIGRGTFSSGLMAAINFRNDLHAILVGEATGGKPNEYGETKNFVLPNSKIVIQYTTKYFRLFEDSDPPALEPDVVIGRSIADFLDGRDQVLGAALAYRWPAAAPK